MFAMNDVIKFNLKIKNTRKKSRGRYFSLFYKCHEKEPIGLQNMSEYTQSYLHQLINLDIELKREELLEMQQNN